MLTRLVPNWSSRSAASRRSSALPTGTFRGSWIMAWPFCATLTVSPARAVAGAIEADRVGRLAEVLRVAHRHVPRVVDHDVAVLRDPDRVAGHGDRGRHRGRNAPDLDDDVRGMRGELVVDREAVGHAPAPRIDEDA